MSNDPQSQFERYTDSEFRALLFNLIPALHNHGTRDHVLHILSKAYKETRNKVIHEEMAPLLWHSIGKISILLQELLSVYPALNEHLTERLSTRVSNALALLQSVAAHTDTRMHFIKANIACYLQPILNIKNNDKYHEHVRISSLQVIGALVKDDDPRGVLFILQSQMLPSFLNCMEVGSITAKTVAVFIIKKILSNEEGMKYCCVLAERFFAIGNILGKIIEELVEAGRLLEDNSKQLLEQIIGCYYKLSANPRACDGLRCCLPSKLKDTSFTSFFHGDQQMMLCLQQIFYNIEVAEWGRSHLYRKLGRHLVRY
ncbi:cell differentiation protein rcd1 isoform X4 [Ricinus communis]|uniref:cell differentiation protein rcd1 isoform X4 n=1 Tax=Ricinus communis TaxID=3988 RepID=UPI00077257C7|nr:cell differentiation protein rcd1 isoform X4 [Ricinus communis]|eukprot:XP_015580964.1 cell differentiation protein rcd1 isoform X2 [Ricinus communis]